MSDMAIEYRRHKFTVDEYHRLGDAGILDEDARVELLDGELIEKLAKMKPPHAAAVESLTACFASQLGDRAIVRCQLPVSVPPDSEPLPDLALVMRENSRYFTRHPDPRDVYLVVEVADSSLEFERRTKLPIYARARIDEVWLVNLVDDVVELHRDPIERRYTTIRIAQRGEKIAALAFPDDSIAVDEILPPQ